jgi:hypothetical protein
MELSLTERLDELLHPTRGVKRGILDFIEEGKGGSDPDDKLINIRIGEIREIHSVLTALKRERSQ